MGYWEEAISITQLGQIPMPVFSRDLDIRRAFGRFKYPGRPGQETDDTGREPYLWSLTCPFFLDMGTDDGTPWYPDRYNELLAFVSDEEAMSEPIEFIDPILGPFTVQVAEVRVREQADKRDGAMIQLRLEEAEAEPSPLFINSIAQARNSRANSAVLADSVDDGLAGLGVTDAILDAVFTEAGFPRVGAELGFTSGLFFSGARDGFFEEQDSGLQTVGSIVQRVDRFRARIDGTLKLDVVQAVDAFRTYTDLVRLADVMFRAGNDAIDDGRLLQELTTAGEIDVWTLALQRYGDASRADEIIELNDIEDPLRIPARTVLRIVGT